MKSLVLAEKPSVGKDIARVLGCKKSSNGYIEGEKYVVSWAMGHLVSLAEPEKYDNKYKSWHLADLPLMPDKLKLVVLKPTAKQFNVVKALVNRKDINEIIIATDAGREGELVARWSIMMAGGKKPMKRLWISSVTDKAIKDGFKSLKNSKEYDKLFYSALSRAEADWLVGINATRALTAKHNASLSCGRVQTPTLAIINQREEEIRSFRSKKYFNIEAVSSGLKLTRIDKNGNINIFNEALANDIVAKIKNKSAVVENIEKNTKKSYPPKLYDLTELQRDANKRYGFSAKETLNIMQQLYERHKVLTYPRTDSKYLTTDIVPTIPERLSALPKEYFKIKNHLLKSNIKANSSFVDDKKVSDHHAIIPTEQPVYYDDFTDKEKKIYNLVVKRFLAVLYPPCEYEEVSIKLSLEGEAFKAKGKTIISKGYKEIYDYDEEDNSGETLKQQSLPKLNKGDRLQIDRVNKLSSMTKPPARFNEATLLSAMENPIKYMESTDKLLTKALGETGGLGTVATRADIIEKLFSSFLIEKKDKDIFITSKGKQLLELVPKDLKSPELTAQWELKLGEIAKGKLNHNSFMAEIREYTKNIITEIKDSDAKFKHTNITSTKCPKCGKPMLKVNGKKGELLVCQDRECGERKSVSLITNSRCPSCHKKLKLVGEGDGRRFVCDCGYSEKYANFKERKKTESNKMNKKQVQSFIKKLNNEKDEPNNPFAALLAQINNEE